jgi:hypothetical protein
MKYGFVSLIINIKVPSGPPFYLIGTRHIHVLWVDLRGGRPGMGESIFIVFFTCELVEQRALRIYFLLCCSCSSCS